ncbi:AMOP domain containing protein [Brugia malayi]|uniref:AMOP domain containing protein n=1 Tax=Brugia malayi TaxID=6279 RepID=A0A4E9EWT4_BRUMA|nr:AMOP domain containing protein [Brugia malayi]VIO87860.1 AMOP domain containing protein [Brugia malayi]
MILSTIFLFVIVIKCLSLLSSAQQIPQQNPVPSTNQENLNPGQEGAKIFTGRDSISAHVNLVPFGPEAGDQKVHPGMLTSGQTINLHMFFPFYGGLYNYSVLSVNGYIAFATVLDQGPTINVGVESTNWPQQQDPAMIAPYLCKQQIVQNPSPGLKTGVYYRLMLRQSLFGRGSNINIPFGGTMEQSSFFRQPASQACPSTSDSYVHCDQNSDYFLDQMMRWLQEGVAGAAAFRADAAFVVTWYNTASAIVGRSDIDAGQLSTYQAIWLTDQPGRLSYVILNYDKLGFDAADFRMNSRSGRCQALFNGGNHTGSVPVDPTFMYKNTPTILAQRSGVPHMVRGRYMFRVDDVVRPAGCSNKTGGTYPMLIYPNIANMLGETSVDVNALCLDRSQTYVLMIEQRQTASCTVINSAIARCHLPKIYDWGTKTVYFQPQSGSHQEDKAFVGYIYFVPPTLDPMRLDIGNVYEWFRNPILKTVIPITWYPRNFTNPDLDYKDYNIRISDNQLYSVQLGLYVIGYREAADDQIKKFRPEHRVLCRLATYTNRNSPDYRWKPQEEKINLYQVEKWYLTDWERTNTLYSYRFGYLKLAPVTANEDTSQHLTHLPSGLVSPPISIHWLWTINNPQFVSSTYSQQDAESRMHFVSTKATEICHDWFAEDGAQYNFIRDTETNASCPCVESQARVDIGRFMPHPRCSQIFRDITCQTMIGAKNCYMSAQNIYGSYAGEGSGYESEKTARFQTHYGQVCCYDEEGKLMQTSYQPVIKVPGLSVFYHDYMPYFFCCKYAKFRCQLFYWRRPSSGCQQYQPPAVGEALGAVSFNTIDNDKFIFNEPGVFTFLYIPKTVTTPEVRIQVRLERYPDRRVDFSLLGRQIGQANLVQPTNATVITGIAIEATGTDRVHVVARKDTRRFRYRTSIIVGNILRYFDVMRIQRFRGVMVYVNNVERGQPEIYVVLEEAQIGIRIRESYNLDIDRLSMYQESMGLLDIELSVPPQYGVRPDGDKAREQDMRTRYNFPRVSGLMRPFPDQTSASYLSGLSLSDVNAEGIRQQIISNYLIPGTGDSRQTMGTLNQNIPTDNMFTTSQDIDKKFEVFPEVYIKSEPIYKTSAEYETGRYRFVPMTGQMLSQRLQTCRDLQLSDRTNWQPLQNLYEQQYGIDYCPDNPSQIIQECGDSVSCLNDYMLFNARLLGMEAQNNWNSFSNDRMHASRHYNSCGPIMIEYPEYLMKTPVLSSGYLEGDVARFDCFQTHWIKGDYEYKCGIVVDYNDPHSYRFEWNKGSQPWCRSREKDNLFKWLTGIFSTIGIIMAIVFIFLCCWTLKQKRRHQAEEKISSLYKVPIRGSMSSETRPFTKARTDSMSSETNGMYHGNEHDSQYRGGPIGGTVPIVVDGSGGYRGETNGQYRAVDAIAPYPEQYHESVPNLSRRPSSPVKTTVIRNNKTVPAGPQSTSSTPPVPVHSRIIGEQNGSDHTQLLGLNTSV